MIAEDHGYMHYNFFENGVSDLNLIPKEKEKIFWRKKLFMTCGS